MNPKKFRGWCQYGCGDEIKKGATKYCSLNCQQAARRAERIALVESGQYSALQITQFLRRYLIQRLGEACTKCGWAERHPLTMKIPIEVEHIDGDWQNYSLANLTLLCPNCHALTSTFRGLNRGRGRAHRIGGRGNPIRDSAKLSKGAIAHRPGSDAKGVCSAVDATELANADVAKRSKAVDL
ncbi:MAG TPA: HNH endonuclease signature motif containing protein [Candidatus Cybelea sp.]|nr:HNH endonuclease signature motif containing protein [Candidatus Cybelea sp.]